MSEVYQAIMAERAHQDEKWGGMHVDDQNAVTHFVDYIKEYMGRALYADITDRPKVTKRRMVQVAALAVACIEMLDRRKEP